MNKQHASMQDHEEAYYLYLKLVDVLVGERVNIALLALSKCKVNLMLANVDDESSCPEKPDNSQSVGNYNFLTME